LAAAFEVNHDFAPWSWPWVGQCDSCLMMCLWISWKSQATTANWPLSNNFISGSTKW